MGAPVRLIHNDFELQDLIETLSVDAALIERDFALVTVVAGLVNEYGNTLCFKGGFVLRHVYGHERFSKDIDATRINPPKNKLDAAEVAATIRAASIRNLLTFNPREPATDSGRSLDFDDIPFSGPIREGHIAVEVSYREDVIETPYVAHIGEPYFEPFEIPVLQLDEIVAEKLRALVQRTRQTDLSDLAMVIERHDVHDARVKTLAAQKFKLVKDGNHAVRIKTNIATMAAQYDSTIPAVAPDAPPYKAASAAVLSKLAAWLP
jgi:predicted nucleotidyltransferase component of viral defense system